MPAVRHRSAGSPARQPALDTATAAARLRAAEASPIARRRLTLSADLAALSAGIARRRTELAADEALFAQLWAEHAALEQDDFVRAKALAPAAPAYLTMQQACGIARCCEATMRTKIRRYGFGWLVDRRWRISEPDLSAHLAGLD